MSAYQFLHFCNDDRLESYAINYLGRKLNFEELFAKIDVAAKCFSELGVKPKDSVAIITGEESKNTLGRLFLYNVVDILFKPFSELDIEKVVSKMIGE